MSCCGNCEIGGTCSAETGILEFILPKIIEGSVTDIRNKAKFAEMMDVANRAFQQAPAYNASASRPPSTSPGGGGFQRATEITPRQAPQPAYDPYGGQPAYDPYGGQPAYDPYGGQPAYDPYGGLYSADPSNQYGYVDDFLKDFYGSFMGASASMNFRPEIVNYQCDGRWLNCQAGPYESVLDFAKESAILEKKLRRDINPAVMGAWWIPLITEGVKAVGSDNVASRGMLDGGFNPLGSLTGFLSKIPIVGDMLFQAKTGDERAKEKVEIIKSRDGLSAQDETNANVLKIVERLLDEGILEEIGKRKAIRESKKSRRDLDD